MPITAKRFKFLDEETNVAVSDFFNPGSSDIFNSTNNELNELTADMEEFLANAIQTTPEDFVGPPSDLRNSNDIFGAIKDLSGYTQKQLDALVGDLFPNNPMAQSTFNQMSIGCRNRPLSRGGMGRPYDPTMNCGGRDRMANSASCNSGQFGNVLGKLTGGSYNSRYNDLNSVLAGLMALSGFGYSMNMCGVFGALSNGVDQNVLSRAAGGLLGNLTSAGNMLGVLDLANSAVGLTPLLENPSGLTSIFDNFSLPDEIPEMDFSSFADRLTGSAEILKDTWANSDHDGILSVANMGSYRDNENIDLLSSATGAMSNYNDDIDSLFSGRRLDNIQDEDNLDAIPSDDFSFLSSAVSKGASSVFDRFI